jgi:DNA-3-methyladenine glycosylase II
MTPGIPSYWRDAKAHLCACDPILSEIVERYEEPPLRSKGQLFETLARSIVGQQISSRAADAVWGRLVTVLGEVSPTAVMATGTEQMRGAGLSQRKVEYLVGLADAADELAAVPWQELPDDEVRRRLCQLRGIGPWTADMILLFTLLRPDILPLGDLGVVRAMEKLYAGGDELDRDALLALAEPWRPFRTVATWYLWRSLDPEPVEY